MFSIPSLTVSITPTTTFDAHVVESRHGRCLAVEHQGESFRVDFHPDDLPPVSPGDRVLVTVLSDHKLALDRVLTDSQHRYSAQIRLNGNKATLSLPEHIETLEFKVNDSVVNISKAGISVNGETISLDAGDDLRLFGSRILNN